MPYRNQDQLSSHTLDTGYSGVPQSQAFILRNPLETVSGQIRLLLWVNVIETMLQLAVGLHQMGKHEEARRAYEDILAHDPAHPHALHLSGALLGQNGQYKEALKRLNRAMHLLPEDAGVMSNLALTLQGLGNVSRAVQCFQRALRLDPDFQPARNGLINLCLAMGETAHGKDRRLEALAWYRRCLTLKPDHASCLNNMAVILQEMGRIDEALEHFRDARDASGNIPFIHSNYLLGLHYSPATTQQEYFMEARAFGTDKPPDACFRPIRRSARGRRLRLGYISGDFSGHAVSTFILPLLEAHDPVQTDTFLFSRSPLQDHIAQWLEAIDMTVVDIHDRDDEQTLSLLRNKKLDLLVDLSGHTAGNGLPVLARRAAPIQATWLGYFNTTGLAAMDYLLADDRCCPKEQDPWHTEKIVRLPASFFCYAPSEGEVPRAAPPCLDGTPFTFGCFNETAKLNEMLVHAWAKILRLAPESRLLLKAKGFADQGIRKRYASLFSRQGIAPERLILEGPSSREQYLASYRKVDLCLDPFPYNGGTVTCDALWMGVPTISLAGAIMVGRMGLSILHAAGLAEWVCHSREEYVQKAAGCAISPETLLQMRSGLRSRLLVSPLCNREMFIKDLMAAYRGMVDQA